MKVLNTKPTLGFVSSNKPTLGNVVSVRPSISKIYGEEMVFKQLYRGMPIGLLLTLTYPETYRT